MLIDAKLPKNLCNYALLTATYIRNRCYNHRLTSTPHEAFTGKELNIQNMNISGNICYVYIHNKKKLDPRSEKVIFVRYDKYSPAYFIYLEQKDSIRKVKSVTFIKRFAIDEKENNNEEFYPIINHNRPIEEKTNLPTNEHNDQTDREITPQCKEICSAGDDRNSRYLLRQQRTLDYLKDYTTGDELIDHDSAYLNVNSYNKIMAIPQTCIIYMKLFIFWF